MWGVAFAWAFLDTAVSLVPRPSPAPVSDRLQYAKTIDNRALLSMVLHTASD